jgi:hypothetical protein
VVRIVAPPEASTSLLVVAITSALRARGFRVGALEARSGLEGSAVAVLTTGSGARITLPGAIELDALTHRAATFDPGLDLLLVDGDAEGTGSAPTIEVIPARAAPATVAATTIGTLTIDQLEAARPSEDFGMAAAIEERLLAGRAGPSPLARTAEEPIESARRLLDIPREPARRTRSWRRWLGL